MARGVGRAAAIVRISLAAGAMVPGGANAQERASIVGQVQESTGAVLPGVTVAAGRPGLIQQVRDVLPAARTMQGGASLVPGVSFYSQGFTSTMSIHGSVATDQHIFFDGMNIGQNLTQSGQQANGVSVNELAQAELVYDAGSQSAEAAVGGVRMDSIPREGGNTYSGIARAFGSKGSFQNDNITPELKPFIGEGNRLDYNYDFNIVFGGPIQRDKPWVFLGPPVSR